MKFPDVILQTAAKILVFIIMIYSIYILFAGHNNPGGGFIGGLITASAIMLLYLAFDVETVGEIIPLDFKIIGAVGVMLALLTGFGAVLFGVPFLTQVYQYVNLPLLGKTGLGTAFVFDLGVYLAVVGTTVTIIRSISEDL
ncbi:MULTISPECIES: Na(+)/H(+) antiporter subunit B [Paenibacillus]|uniref:Monovalent cation/H+ antiporter subunit B n=1 Tax=Paenibacillus agaridevorans TaxID=171404 RepID=A0A2R5EW53_9BACL|nr:MULTISPECIES: Na(+)/H(+) antiporter subunit B [Paenibacillus]QNK57126.1 Na(+)/H(+) antiporter subunit B [Paenibacillus sp. PAMC21692]GBG10932.1 monovalent cation/H+ antiporter subunit B [Paenibacillus agaridevorans]